MSEEQRAARLIGRKIITVKQFAGRDYEVMYRVDHYRRFIPRRGLGLGLVEFYGPRAVRVVEQYQRPGKWELEGDETFCHIVSVKDPNERFKLK